MVANPTWDPNGSWNNVRDYGDPWTVIPAEWEQGWFAASGISNPVNSGSPKNNSANISIVGGVLNMKVANIGGINYGCLMTTNPSNSGTSTGFTLTPPYAVEAQLFIPGPAGSVLVPNWVAFWSDGQNWPGDGEVDAIESLGVPDWNSFHWHGPGNPNGIGGTANMSPHPYGLHTVGYYRSATQVRWYYDGILVGTEPADSTSPHYLILTHTYNGSPDLIPSTLGVHWVRAWTPSQAPTTGMVVTAAAAGTQTAAGVALSVRVLTGAAQTQAGATAHNDAMTTPELTLTPAASGSLIMGALANGAAQKFTQQDPATTFYQNVGDASTNEAYCLFRSAAVTAAGVPVTVGATGPGPGGQMLGAAAEIQAAPGQVIAEDPTSPAAVFAAALAASTAGFTPPGGSVLVALVSANYNNAGTPTVTMAVTDSTGLTWTQLAGNLAGQDLTSVWVAGAAPVTPPPPITGPPPTSRQLIVSAAPKSGVDPYGNPFPQGFQVGPSTGPQVQVVPLAGGAQVRFPVPAPMLSNVPNLAALAVTPSLADLLLSGPALAAAGARDWVQLAAFSNDGAGSAAMLQFRYIDTTGAVTVTAEYNGGQWLFNELATFAGLIAAQNPAAPGTFEPWHSLGNYPSGTTTRGQYRLTPTGKLELDINLTGTPASGTASFPNTLPAAYRPSVTKRAPATQGTGGVGWVSVSTAGVVSCIIAANATTTFDCPAELVLT